MCAGCSCCCGGGGGGTKDGPPCPPCPAMMALKTLLPNPMAGGCCWPGCCGGGFMLPGPGGPPPPRASSWRRSSAISSSYLSRYHQPCFNQVSDMLDQSLTSLLLLHVHLVLLHLEDLLTNDLKLLELRCHYFVWSVSGTLSKAYMFDSRAQKQLASPCTAAFHHGQRCDTGHPAEEYVEEPLQSCWQVSYWRACDSNSILMPSRSSLRRPMF